MTSTCGTNDTFGIGMLQPNKMGLVLTLFCSNQLLHSKGLAKLYGLGTNGPLSCSNIVAFDQGRQIMRVVASCLRWIQERRVPTMAQVVEGKVEAQHPKFGQTQVVVGGKVESQYPKFRLLSQAPP
ncbi:hypothetical protein JHK87_024649 [Glycine soja]|nr:hypothetical protein JHK87_024649 [Glycine soja]